MSQIENRPKGRGRISLTQTVVEVLRERIESGKLQPGDKLPTEQALVQEFGVSRTVIREAVAGLRADGLLEPRQGSGVYVCEPKPRDGLSFLADIPGRVPTIINALELRAAVEIEAAGLAAERCSPAQEERIRECFQEIESCIAGGASTESADFAFHAAIADATNNQHFREFLEFLGRRTIPRSQLRPAPGRPDYMNYISQLQSEHADILEAISRRSPEAARDAMRVHLKGSLARYRALMSARNS